MEKKDVYVVETIKVRRKTGEKYDEKKNEENTVRAFVCCGGVDAGGKGLGDRCGRGSKESL